MATDYDDSGGKYDELPDEVLVRIFKNFSALERVRCEAVCQRWYALLRNEIWIDTHRIEVSSDSVHLNSCSTRSISKLKQELIVPAAISIMERSVYYLEHLSFKNLLMNQIDAFENSKKAGEILSMLAAAETLTRFDISDIVFDVKHREKSKFARYLERYCLIKSIRTLVFDSNSSLDFAGSPFVSSFFSAGVFPNLTQLTALHIEDISLSSRVFHKMCTNLAPTLQKFCFKLPDCKLHRKSLSDALKLLTKLEELNVGGRRPHLKSVSSLINDSVIQDLFGSLTLLKSLSIRSAVPVTNNGMFLLLKLCPRLECLNIIRCCNITIDGFSDFLDSGNDRNLLVYTYGTKIWADCEIIGKNKSKLRCVSDLNNIDESIFWGERKLESQATNARTNRENEFDMSLIVNSDESFIDTDSNSDSSISDDDNSEMDWWE